MKHSLQVAKVRGIPIRVHWSFGLLVLLVVLAVKGSGLAAILGAVLWLALLFGSVVFHELAHSLVALRRGIAVRDIVLLPIGGVSEIPELARTPEDELRISLAGPLASLVLAVVVGAGALLAGVPLWPPSLSSGGMAAELAWVNVLLAAFNLLPALPLDGGRVLRSLLARRRGELEATAIAVRVGKAFGIAMMVVGAFVDLWLALIGLFVVFGAQGEGQAARLHAALGDRHVGDLPTAEPFVLPAWMPAGQAASQHQPYWWRTIVVVGEQGYLGLVSPEVLAAAAPDARLEDLADRAAPLLDPRAPLFPTALDAFAQSRARELAVGTHGRVEGTIAATDVELMLRRSAAAPLSKDRPPARSHHQAPR